MANSLIGAAAVATHMYQAFYGQAPSNALYNSYVADINATSEAAFAARMASNFSATSDSALTLLILGNLGITATTIPATEYDKLKAALTEAFAAFPTMRGQVLLNATNLFANLEADVTYGAAATTYNKQALANFTYASNTANTTPAVAPIPDPAVGTTYTLTTAVDTFTGGAANDTFNALGTTLTGLDALDGGAGTDVLNVVDATGAVINVGLPTTVKNIETANFTSLTGMAAGVADVSAWTGLTQANFTLNDIGAAQTITAAATTGVLVTESQLTAANSTTVVGGSTVTVNNTFGKLSAALDNSASTITVNGTTTTGTGKLTSVTVSQTDGSVGATGKTAKVVIADPATTDALATVSITGGNSGTAATIASDALTALNLTKTADGATVTAAAATRALALTVNGTTAGTVTDATATSLTVTSTGAASTLTALTAAAAKSVTLTGDKALTLTGNTFAAATSLTVSDSALVTMTAAPTTTAKLTSVTVTGAGGFKADLSAQGTQLVTIDASASSGANTIVINGTEIYKGGSGVDTVTSAVAPTVSVDGGAGTDDVFVVNAASYSLTKVTGFETLGAGAGATGAYSSAGFANITEGAVTGAVTWNTVAAGTGLTITAAPGFATTYTLATDTTTDTLNLTLTSAAAIAANTVNATNVETVNITVTDSNSTKHQDSLTLASGTANAMSIKVTGNAGLALTDTTDLNITSVDASGLTNTAAGAGFTWTSGILNKAAVTVLGSAAGGDNINLSAATQKVTLTEYAGTNTVVGSATKANTITGGTGADTITGGSAADTVVGGGGADVITAGGGADKITITGTTATIKAAALLDSGANTSTTIQTSELTSTFDVVYGVSAGVQLDLTAVVAAGSTTNLAGANLAGANDSISFARGTYDSAAGTFTYAANGADSAVTYDTTTGGGTAFETIILVGYVTGATTGTGLLAFA